MKPSSDSITVNVGGAGIDVGIDNKFGAGIRVEYRFTDHLAAEIGMLGTSSIDVYAGTFLAIIDYGDID